MSLRDYLLTAFFVSLWRTAAAATELATAGRNLTNNAIPRSPTVPTRLTTTVTPRQSKPHASGREVDDVNEINEMRGPSLLMEAVQGLCKYKAELSGMHLDPHDEMVMLEFFPIYSHWRTYARGFKTGIDIYGKNDVAVMAKFFHWLRNVEGMMDRADVMQHYLFGNYPYKAESAIFKLWAESNLKPKDVYHMMPIAAVQPLQAGVLLDDEVRSFYGQMFLQWLEYYDVFRGKTADEFDDAEAIRDLAAERSMEEVQELIAQLQRDPKTKIRADQLVKALSHVDTDGK